MGLNAIPQGKKSGLLSPDTLLPIAVPTADLSFAAAPFSNLIVTSLGVDGKVYGRIGAMFPARTTADGSSTEFGYNFAGTTEHTGSVGTLHWTTRTEAGYVAISGVGTNVYVWFSTAFATGWTKVLTVDQATTPRIGIPQPVKGRDGKTVLFLGIWNSGGTAKKLNASYDGGATWSQIKTSPVVNAGINSHWHTAVYHPRSDTTFVSGGDGVNAYFGRSHNKGVDWIDMPTPTTSPIYDGVTYQQPTVMVPFDERISLGPDRGTSGMRPGFWSLDPDTGLTTPNFVLDDTVDRPDYQYPLHPFAQRGREAYVAFPASSSMPVGTRDHTDIAATGDGGRSWHKVARIAWGGADLSTYGIAGPDQSGYLWMNTPTGLNRAKVLDWTWQTP